VGAFAFNQHADGYSLEHAYWLGRAARLAYGDESEIRADTEKWGFDQLQISAGHIKCRSRWRIPRLILQRATI